MPKRNRSEIDEPEEIETSGSSHENVVIDQGNEVQQEIRQSLTTVKKTLLQKSTTELRNEISTEKPSRSCSIASKQDVSNIQGQIRLSEVASYQDDVILPNSLLSIGTTIKRACLKNFGKYAALQEKERNIIDLGANSILDTAKENCIQWELFDIDQWRWIYNRYQPRFNDFECVVDYDDDVRKKVEELEKISRRDVGAGRGYANKEEFKRKGVESTLFDFYSEYLKMLQFRSKFSDVTWILLKVIGPLKGESIGDCSKVVGGQTGFKVDVRVVRDNYGAQKSKRESDTGNGELAKAHPSIGKITHDKAKLYIESKCVVDKLIAEIRGGVHLSVPAIQLAGLEAKLYSLKLEEDGVYVGVLEGRCTLPTTASNLRQLQDTYKLLQKFYQATKKIADELNQKGGDQNAINMLRPTWIPPKKLTHIKPLPVYLFS
ncbi:hypothetical protein INT45_009825 [Circinella minor]|uniref:Uncharacterized protein n=1 Tax=Circinella minor TaxID=1195481 RepID=A0A8H7VKK9_9FUNG|nr:hypothetical protein INT45_009825 [Circinella minor]